MGSQVIARLATPMRRWAAGLVACTVLTLQTGCRAEIPWPLWQAYRAKFIDSSGRVIDHDPGRDDRTTSEGMAYGMFFALVTNDRATFDKMQRWTEDNLAAGDLTAHLPAWEWGKSPDGAWKPLDTNSAADADLWMAYDFLEAGRLWKDDRLLKLGTVMSERIAQSEVALVPGLGTVVLPASQGFHPEANTFVLNTSYLPPQVIARLRKESPGGPWGGVLETLPQLVQGSAPAGWAMDWVSTSGSVHPSPTPAELATGKPGFVPIGSYESIRTYLWLGMADQGTTGVEESLRALPAMAAYLNAAPIPPLQVDSSGKVLKADSPVGFSAAVLPYLMAVGRKNLAAQQMNRLEASRQPDGLYGRSSLYYDQNLALFATGWQEARFRFDKDGRLKLKWK